MSPPRAGAGARIAAGIGGAFALLVATLFTGGFALPAPLGMAISRVVVRGRGRTPSLFTSWLGAIIAVGVAVAITFGALATRKDLVREVRQTVDSVMAANQSSGSPLGPTASRVVATYAGAAGLLAVALMMGTIAGSVGWLASRPLRFAITGRWREPVPVEPLPPEL